MSASSAFALALLRLDGIGRVTAGRLLRHFPTYDALAACPREQVLLRIKGAPNAGDIVARLFDAEAMREQLAEAERALADLAARQIRTLTAHDADWPAGLDALDRAERPVLLYTYGDPAALTRPAVALLARPPLDGPAYELAQALVRRLIAQDLVVAGGADHGFDLVVHKLCASAGRPSVLVANAGLARVPGPMRPIASAAVRAGGVLLSPFPLTHGPFAHDDRERALIQAALARAVAVFGPQPDSSEWRAMTWALEHGRPVFGVAGAAPLPEGAQPLEHPEDLDRVIAAATSEAA